MSLPSYAYNASAIGLGGIIRRGKRTTIIPTIGSVCLASAGGEGSNTVEYYDRDGISFTRAQTRVGGYSVKKGAGYRHSTFAEVLLLNLRIFDRLSIARMQAVVLSTRDIESDDPAEQLVPDQTRFSVKLLYHGVEIDGEEFEPAVDTELCESQSYDNFTRILRGRRPQLLETTQKVLDAQAAMPYGAPPVAGPLVSFPGNGVAKANRFPIQGFGHARFGDLIVKQDRQRVSLLRMNLDSGWSPRRPSTKLPVLKAAAAFTTQSMGDGEGGAVTTGDSGSNGVPIWEQG